MNTCCYTVYLCWLIKHICAYFREKMLIGRRNRYINTRLSLIWNNWHFHYTEVKTVSLGFPFIECTESDFFQLIDLSCRFWWYKFLKSRGEYEKQLSPLLRTTKHFFALTPWLIYSRRFSLEEVEKCSLLKCAFFSYVKRFVVKDYVHYIRKAKTRVLLQKERNERKFICRQLRGANQW